MFVGRCEVTTYSVIADTAHMARHSSLTRAKAIEATLLIRVRIVQ
jgi:hypothetical protein